MRHLSAIILMTCATSACDWLTPPDPCALNNPLAPPGSDVAADCEACGQSPCTDETGETGDEVEVTQLTCETYALDGQGQGEQYCFVGNYDIPILNPDFAQWPYVHKNKSDCAQLSDEFPCNRTWHAISSNHAGGQQQPSSLPENGDSANTMCVLCQTKADTDLPYDPGDKVPAGDNAGWRLCSPNVQSGNWHPASVDILPAGASGWIDNLRCAEYTDPGFACPLGFVAVDQPDDHSGRIFYSSFTCSCHGSDDACQPGAVCEAGWTIDGEDLYPSLCTWDDGSGTMNGAASDGPVVYGLAQWSDGIVVNRSNVTLSPSLVLALVPGVFNDDMLFAPNGEVLHCGQESLCTAAGLQVGDVITVGSSDIAALLLGRSISIPLQRAGVVTTMTITIGSVGQ
jgi:hypothetical protein